MSKKSRSVETFGADYGGKFIENQVPLDSVVFPEKLDSPLLCRLPKTCSEC